MSTLLRFLAFGKALKNGSFHNKYINQSYQCQHTAPSKGVIRNIDKILIANRSEIAVRVMKTAQHMGIKTVAVYSDVDRDSMFVKMADEAYHIGGAASLDSYLRMDRVIEAAKKSGAQAIHPGYGFLSENMEFAELCQKEDIIFIGPPSNAIRDMGIKSTSKYIMSAAGVPIIQGYHGEEQSEERLMQESEKIGFPVMIKAVRGGGGKGMRIAQTREVFLSQLESARNEAYKAYNDTVVLIEKYVDTPRHVEVQVFGDKHGNYVYLFERDCSVQRRHQKIIEEAPAPHLTEATRKSLGEAAVKAAMAVNYVGAGTVEFIMDKDEKFFFMEMNTRLQVEHPVTEMITGTDLVQWQIMVASGKELPMKQSDLKIKGHSVEGRIYAEDPNNLFMPGAGHLDHLSMPELVEGMVRVETGVRQGDDVSVHYDPMIAKLIVWAEDRQSALIKLQQALREYNIVGLGTNIQFLDDLAGNEVFQAGKVHTGFIQQNMDKLFPKRVLSCEDVCVGALALVMVEKTRVFERVEDSFSPFNNQIGFRSNHYTTRKITLNNGSEDVQVSLTYKGGDQYEVSIGDLTYKSRATLAEEGNKTVLYYSLGGRVSKCSVVLLSDVLHVFSSAGSYKIKIPQPIFVTSTAQAPPKKGARSPMPGVVDKVFVGEGDRVKEGDPVAVIIAMKMEYVLRAVKAGVVKEVIHNVGETVRKNAEVVLIEEDAEEV